MAAIASASEVVARLQSFGFYCGMGWSTHDAIDLANSMGQPIGEPSPVHRIRPLTEIEARPNTLSERYGLGPFPFHTETAYWPVPARYLLLRCARPGSGGRSTLVVDSHQWGLSARDRHCVTSEVFKVAGRRPFLANLATPCRNSLSWRFDRDCMTPVTRGAERARRILENVIEHSRNLEINWSFGDLLVLDNHRCFHARGIARSVDKDRLLERILVGENS